MAHAVVAFLRDRSAPYARGNHSLAGGRCLDPRTRRTGIVELRTDACTNAQKPMNMFRSILFITCLGATGLSAQNDALSQLVGTGQLSWIRIGTQASTGPCKTGDGSSTFQAKPAQVVVQECSGGTMKPYTLAITEWSANGKSGIAFGGARYEVKTLPATAPACKGNANCVRLVTVPDGKTDATRTIYLTH